MSEIKDGWSAFPRPAHRVDGADGSSTIYYPQDGMSLRDWFAGQALAGICGDGIPGSHHVPASTVRDAYDLADQMLKARSGEPTLRDALEDAHNYLETVLRPCDAGCECVLHIVERALGKPDSRSRR